MTAETPQLLRLSGIPASKLPPVSASSATLTAFLQPLLAEALPFIDSAASGQDGWRAKGSKHQRPTVEAAVDLSERVVGHETWACRRSVHEDAARAGTASWEEFVDALRERHVETEDAFTPAVVGSWVAARWEEKEDEEQQQQQKQKRKVQLVEMKHRMPVPGLQARVFVVLQVVVTEQDGQGFAVVSVPVTGDEQELRALGCKLSVDKGVVQGAYVAVERVRRSSKGPDGHEIEWMMATASDARGVLPMWVQTKAVLGVVAKDVSLFLGWQAGERDKK